MTVRNVNQFPKYLGFCLIKRWLTFFALLCPAPWANGLCRDRIIEETNTLQGPDKKYWEEAKAVTFRNFA